MYTSTALLQTFCGALLLLAGAAFAADAPRNFTPYDHPVMSWVPPYAIGKAKARLSESFDGIAVKDGLTHLGLQLWVPAADGGLARAGKFGEIDDAAIIALRDWGHAHGVRVLLCVFNGQNKWDWPLAKNAFAANTQKFVDVLVAEVERLDLDGVDIDLEGNGSFDADKAAFIEFTAKLSARLHATNRHLTVDTFSYIWNAPNQTWWKDLFPLVDGLTTMGYQELGEKPADWRGYTAQKTAAGADATKLMLGMPTDKAQWRGSTAAEQLSWVVKDGGVGVSLWDIQLPNAAWRSRAVWEELGKIRKKP